MPALFSPMRIAYAAMLRLAKLVLLMALLAGIPYGLLTQVGSPLPHRLPTTDQVHHLITGPVSDALVLDLLALALWILWAAFLISVTVEVHAVIRGVPRPRLGPIVPLQTLAGWLVAGVTAGVLAAAPVIAVSAHASPAAAAVAHTPTRPAPVVYTAVTAPPAPATGTTAAALRTTETANRAPATQPGVYEVRHGDWLGGIAQRFLGDFDTYPQIAQLNPDLVTDPNLIEPGWRLILPADAVDRGLDTHATGRLVIAPSATAPAPNGPAASDASPPTNPASDSDTPAAPASMAPVPPPSSAPSPSPTARGTSTATASGPSIDRSAPANHGDATPDRAPHAQQPSPDRGVTLPGGWIDLPVGAALVAAAAVVWLRRRHRYISTPLANPSGDGNDGNDEDLRPLPAMVNRVRRAVREQAPELLDPPTSNTPTVAAYRAADAQHRPDLPPVGPSGPDLAGLHDRIPVGGLGLLGPGAEPAARGLLVATLSSGTPADPDAKGQVIITADALTTLLGADAVQIGEIPRLETTLGLSEALTRAEELIIERRRLLQDHEATDLDTMRAADPFHPPMPPVLLLAEAPPTELRARLTTTLHLGGPLQITAVLLGDWPRGDTLTVTDDGRTNDPTSRRLAVLNVPSSVQLLQVLREAHTGRLPTAAVEAPPPADLATPAPATEQSRPPDVPGDDPATPDAFDPQPMPDATAADPTPDTDHAGAGPAVPEQPTTPDDPSPDLRRPRRHRVRVRLLGEATIIDRDGKPVPDLRLHARELLVYLTVHRSGADLTQIMEAFWPNAAVRRAGQRLSTEAGNVRGCIRQAAGDKNVQPVVNTGGRYHLNPDLLDIDVWRLVDTLRQAATTTDPDARATLLRAAIEADAGILAQGYDYDWIEQPREQLRRHGIRARLDLAALLADDQPREAADLAQAAASLDPINEDLARQAMRALARVNDAAAVRAVLNQLRTALDDIDEEPSAETIGLAAQLQRAIAPGGKRAGDEHRGGADSNAVR